MATWVVPDALLWPHYTFQQRLHSHVDVFLTNIYWKTQGQQECVWWFFEMGSCLSINQTFLKPVAGFRSVYLFFHQTTTESNFDTYRRIYWGEVQNVHFLLFNSCSAHGWLAHNCKSLCLIQGCAFRGAILKILGITSPCLSPDCPTPLVSLPAVVHKPSRRLLCM